MKRHPLYHLSDDDIVHLAKQYIHHWKYRAMFIDRYCEGLDIGEIAEKYQFEYRYVQTILKECMSDVLIHA